ncbi:MAG: SPOR domain-containing protein [Pseudoxanthomonas suwonensis]|nr:SPOR domain-containing protein [Pseudoxanthomonas suwonensis]
MDSGLKQRLIGAAVLIALAVIFLPMLVKGPAPESGIADVPLSMPDAPEGEFVTRELPLVRPGGAGEGGALNMPRPVQPDQQDVTTTPAAALPAATAGGRFAVHFGAYGSRGDADAVNAPLRDASLPGYVEETRVGERQAWRVRIGPFATRAEAEAARLAANAVRDDVGARVVTLDAGDGTAASAPTPATPTATTAPTTAPATPAARPATAPATEPSRQQASSEAPRPAAPEPKPEPAPTPRQQPKPPAPAVPAASDVGFAVQLGAFGNAEEATRLRDRARAAGFSAFTEQVRGESGPLTRVRVGPVASRADAERLKAQVDGRLGTAGMVRPHP